MSARIDSRLQRVCFLFFTGSRHAQQQPQIAHDGHGHVFPGTDKYSSATDKYSTTCTNLDEGPVVDRGYLLVLGFSENQPTGEGNSFLCLSFDNPPLNQLRTMLAPSNHSALTALAARLARALVRTGSPVVTAILPTAIQAENIITNPSDVFLTGFDLYTLVHNHLEFQTLISAPKQRERDDAATLISNLDSSRREIASGGVPNTPVAQKAQAAFLQSISATMTSAQVGVRKIDEKRDQVFYQLAEPTSLAPSDATNEAITNLWNSKTPSTKPS
jgi:hypothetical protein